MKRAYCMIRENIKARHDTFVQGLRAAGYEVSCGAPQSANPGDALLIWNRRGHEERIADKFESGGGSVFVAEEGYVRRDKFYALARRYHNGGGEELADDPARAALLGVDLHPWREGGEGHVLVCPNRFIGPSAALMPADWPQRTAAQVRKLTGREARVRPHPGMAKDALVNGRTLAEDLAGAWRCVVWWSSAGIAALLAGVPVAYCAPWWIASAAALRLDRLQQLPPLGGREAALRRIANAQFTPAEIRDGIPFMARPR